MRRPLVRVLGSNCTTCAFQPRGAPSHVHRDALASVRAQSSGVLLSKLCHDPSEIVPTRTLLRGRDRRARTVSGWYIWPKRWQRRGRGLHSLPGRPLVPRGIGQCEQLHERHVPTANGRASVPGVHRWHVHRRSCVGGVPHLRRGQLLLQCALVSALPGWRVPPQGCTRFPSRRPACGLLTHLPRERPLHMVSCGGGAHSRVLRTLGRGQDAMPYTQVLSAEIPQRDSLPRLSNHHRRQRRGEPLRLRLPRRILHGQLRRGQRWPARQRRRRW